MSEKNRAKNKDLKRFMSRKRANLLEEMGRIDARKHPDAADRAEKRRVIGELNKGYNKGGLIKGAKAGAKDEKKRIIEDLKKRRREDPFPSDALSRKRRASGGLIKGKPKLAKKGWK